MEQDLLSLHLNIIDFLSTYYVLHAPHNYWNALATKYSSSVKINASIVEKDKIKEEGKKSTNIISQHEWDYIVKG